MKKSLLTYLFILLSACQAAHAQSGSTAYEFLNIPVSAHSAAVGGHNVSICDDDITLMFDNPASISYVYDKTLNLDYTGYIQSTMKLSAAFNKQVGERGTWAIGGQFLNYGSMDETDASGNKTGTFSAKDINIQATYAYMLNDFWSGGVTLKGLISNYANYSSFAIGADLALTYHNAINGWGITLAGRNFGGQIDPLYEDREALPFDLAFGVSKRFAMAPLRLHFTFDDLTHWQDINFIQHLILGADIFIGSNVWIGAGYNFRQAHEMKTTDGSSHMAGFNIGGGLNIRKFKIGLAWGKYHASASSLIVNASFSL